MGNGLGGDLFLARVVMWVRDMSANHRIHLRSGAWLVWSLRLYVSVSTIRNNLVGKSARRTCHSRWTVRWSGNIWLRIFFCAFDKTITTHKQNNALKSERNGGEEGRGITFDEDDDHAHTVQNNSIWFTMQTHVLRKHTNIQTKVKMKMKRKIVHPCAHSRHLLWLIRGKRKGTGREEEIEQCEKVYIDMPQIKS